MTVIDDPHKSRRVCPFVHSSVSSSFFTNFVFTESVRNKTDILVGNAENVEAVGAGVCSAVRLSNSVRPIGSEGRNQTLNEELAATKP
jgi:hypothetical protein